ncbi:MAG: thioredoxin-disulfide reductase [bacterium]|nr:thioredoxin-disulfide reductase [bacterium]
MAVKEHELVIIGGGPAGLTAGIYAARSRLDVILVELNPMVGGQMALTDIVENYPGFPEPLTGFELAQKMRAQAERFDLAFVTDTINGVTEDNGRYLLSGDKGEYLTDSIIVSSGSTPRELGVPGELEYRGGGVTYCATCDGPFTKDMEVAVIGGGDSAVGEALYLTKFATNVHVVHRRDEFRADAIIVEEAISHPKIKVHWDTICTEILGNDDNEVHAVTLKNVKTDEEKQLPVQYSFIYVGVNPNTGFLDGFVNADERGFVTTDDELRASKPGIFAAGDCRSKTLKQVATAVGEGALAAFNANEYIERLKASKK